MSSHNGATLYRPARGAQYDIDGIDFPRPSYAPAIWLCFNEPGRAATAALNHWLAPPATPDGNAEPPTLFPRLDEHHNADSLDLLRRITRVINQDTYPAGFPPYDPLYARIKTALEEIMRVPEIRGGDRDDLIVPHLWVVGDLAHSMGRNFYEWLDTAVGELRKNDIVCRVTAIVRFVRENTSYIDPEGIKGTVAWLADKAANVESNLSSGFRLLVACDRDRRGALFAPHDLSDAIGHFAEFILLARSPGAISTAILPLFKAHEAHQPGATTWEHLPIFGSIWPTRIQIKESDAKLRINPGLRKAVSASITADPPEFWVPETPGFHLVDVIRGVRWRPLEQPTWRTFHWEEAREETQRMASEIDRWLEAAAHWRKTTLANYVELGDDIHKKADQSVKLYWDDLAQLGALVLDDPAYKGGLSLLERLVERALIDIDFELEEFPALGPTTMALPATEDDQVAEFISKPAEPVGEALEELGERIARRVHPFQLILLTALCAFVVRHWTLVSIRRWNESGFGWIGRLNLPLKVRDPILLGISHRADDVPRWLDRAGLGFVNDAIASISMLHWVLISFILGAIVFDALVLLLDRWGMHRAFGKLRTRTQTWGDTATTELPKLLVHRENVTNKAELAAIRFTLERHRQTLRWLKGIAENHGVVPLPRDTAFATNVRLASPAFSPVTPEDVESVTMGIRHELAGIWLELLTQKPKELGEAFVRIVLDQEEPVTARGGRIVHDPRSELGPLIDMIKSRMPNRANVLVPPMAVEAADEPVTSFSRIVSLPAHSSGIVRDSLDSDEFADVIFVSHEPERVAFVIGLELDVPAKEIFGDPPRPLTAPTSTPPSMNGDGDIGAPTNGMTSIEPLLGEEPAPAAAGEEGGNGAAPAAASDRLVRSLLRTSSAEGPSAPTALGAVGVPTRTNVGTEAHAPVVVDPPPAGGAATTDAGTAGSVDPVITDDPSHSLPQSLLGRLRSPKGDDTDSAVPEPEDDTAEPASPAASLTSPQTAIDAESAPDIPASLPFMELDADDAWYALEEVAPSADLHVDGAADAPAEPEPAATPANGGNAPGSLPAPPATSESVDPSAPASTDREHDSAFESVTPQGDVPTRPQGDGGVLSDTPGVTHQQQDELS